MNVIIALPMLLTGIAIGAYLSPLLRSINVDTAVHFLARVRDAVRPVPAYRGRHWATA